MLRLVPANLRSAFEALWRIDAAMRDVVARATQPALAAIKLAWWRERLQELDEKVVPAEPRLRAAAQELLPHGVSGAELAALEGGWASLLQEEIQPDAVAHSGAALFVLGARLLGAADPKLDAAGALYAFVAAGRVRPGYTHVYGVDDAVSVSRHRFPRKLRPLTALARLAILDMRHGTPFKPEGTPPRYAAMLRHQWTGVVAWRR